MLHFCWLSWNLAVNPVFLQDFCIPRRMCSELPSGKDWRLFIVGTKRVSRHGLNAFNFQLSTTGLQPEVIWHFFSSDFRHWDDGKGRYVVLHLCILLPLRICLLLYTLRCVYLATSINKINSLALRGFRNFENSLSCHRGESTCYPPEGQRTQGLGKEK